MINVVDISPTPFPTETLSSGCSGVKWGRLTRSICLVRNKAWRWCGTLQQAKTHGGSSVLPQNFWIFLLSTYLYWTLLDIRDLYPLFGFAICRVLCRLMFFHASVSVETFFSRNPSYCWETGNTTPWAHVADAIFSLSCADICTYIQCLHTDSR